MAAANTYERAPADDINKSFGPGADKGGLGGAVGAAVASSDD